jgi:hypothetical protein
LEWRVATPAELASTEDPVGACDEEAEVMPAGKRPPVTEINGIAESARIINNKYPIFIIIS